MCEQFLICYIKWRYLRVYLSVFYNITTYEFCFLVFIWLFLFALFLRQDLSVCTPCWLRTLCVDQVMWAWGQPDVFNESQASQGCICETLFQSKCGLLDIIESSEFFEKGFCDFLFNYHGYFLLFPVYLKLQ